MSQPVTRLRWAAALATGGLVTGLLFATGGVYERTKHGHPAHGVRRLDSAAVGDCGQCHDMHASRDGVPTGGPYPYALFTVNDNTLCYTADGSGPCHAVPGALAIYPGPSVYDASAHRTSPAMVWPGPDPRARPAGDAGLCLNCHTPHGRADASGPIPAQAIGREEALCETCHDASGPAATDVASEFDKPSRHPAPDIAGVHDQAEGGDPAAYGNDKRHAECSDCHNPHDVAPDSTVPTPPEASARVQRVARVAVTNGPAGSVPAYTYRPPDDPAPALEYEICFKCHSSWTTQPPGQPDLAVRFNPDNPSYHPVEAAGTNPHIRSGAFVPPWGPASLVYCSDCHGSDSGAVEGPHGSLHDHLLRAPYVTSSDKREMVPDELCFGCHNYDTYANDDASDTVAGQSRFNGPEFGKGHTFHVAKKGYPCYACHESHGSTDKPALIATGRNPGLNDYRQTPDGGTCYPTCHRDESYDINYPR